MSNTACLGEKFGRKPNCVDDKTGCFSIKRVNLLWIIFSKTFESTGRREIGR